MFKKNKKPKLPRIFGNKGKMSSGGGSGGRGIGGLADIIVSIVVFLAILFVLMGGINQRKFIESTFKLGEDIGKTVSGWFGADNIEINEDGVYIKP